MDLRQHVAHRKARIRGGRVVRDAEHYFETNAWELSWKAELFEVASDKPTYNAHALVNE
jgi:hypothetical protein